MYYKKSITALRNVLLEKVPHSKPMYQELPLGMVAPTSYLLWMCAEVKAFDTKSEKCASKAGRWVGWMFAHAELKGLFSNKQTRDLMRKDVEKGLDKPH